MLDYIIAKTALYLEDMPKSKRKNIGQFFTSKETAQYMAKMFGTEYAHLHHLDILDPGAGSGILSAALIEEIIMHPGNVASITLTCYETNPDILPLLKQNAEYLHCYLLDNSNIDFQYIIIENDYILSQAEAFNSSVQHAPLNEYDLIIGNPPYLRVLRDNEAAMAMPKVVHGAPNLYFLFASISMFNLKNNGMMVYIIPRSWTSGAYFEAFRKYFLSQGKLKHLHLFVSRDKVFAQEEVLQETMILSAIRTNDQPDKVKITSSQSNSDFSDITTLYVPYSTVVSGANNYVYLPTNEEDMRTIQRINQFKETLPQTGYKMKTGIVVDFRQRNELRKEPGENIIPLFYSQHIKNGRVNHSSSGKDYDWMVDTVPGLIQRNKDYIFCKRFTAKEERRRLQCGIYFAEDFPQYQFIGTQNKINFIDSIDKSDIPRARVYGLYALFNSTLFDNYYRILNGSTQVNSTEVNNIPVPPLSLIDEIGEKLLSSTKLTTTVCDKILEDVAYGKA